MREIRIYITLLQQSAYLTGSLKHCMLPIGHAGLAEIWRGLSHAAQFSRLYTAGVQHAGQQLPMVRVLDLSGQIQCSSSIFKKPCLQQVAIIGRPNVGKSAMFNRLVKRRSALVSMTAAGDGPDGG